MRRMILLMIASSSLSAFSTAVGQSRLPRLVAATPARQSIPQAAAPGAALARTQADQAPAPRQIVPRGSLLDLSV